MANYKVLVDFELEGAVHADGSEIELSEEVATPLIAEGKLEIVASAE
jgi:hypothetical protein